MGFIRVHTPEGGKVNLNPLWIVGYKENPNASKGSIIYTADGNEYIVLDSPKSIDGYIRGVNDKTPTEP